ncbi:Acetoin dehydrogenase operon transcriptional activator AcoR [compost metagenome]|uniref:sigma-54-dependent Fis family transcriptional regulator n=1 Tax=Pseudomonas TaxID=286 RepID=UPI0004252728|nr:MULTISPECIES: sigma-54-dependent Fis family transcriptional regulator [Pseudomonas]MCW2268148.1 transcriptional regulator of acetoin/glycerol metabolism [Pseudomonas sp. JUb96]PRA67878.1 sigma-54-dependent Fis family transcriptional regulator [Pseudomonas sp. MYb187]
MSTLKTTTNALPPSTRLAREMLSVDGQVPEGVLRAEIDASWRRSLDHGVGVHSRNEVSLASAASLDLLLARNRLLLDAATAELDYLRGRQGDDGLIILANADATILAVEGTADTLRTSSQAGIAPGTCWSEAERGTNALGTALVEARTVQIDCGEHFLERLADYSCTSVPIHCPQGELFGVLDLTREGPLGRLHDRTALLALAVSQIEGKLFNNSYPEQIVLAFHSRRHYLDSPWQGLLALGMDGRIVAASNQACQLLASPRDNLIGQRCDGLLGMRLEQWLARLQQGKVEHVETAKGGFFYKTLQVPQRPLSVSVPALQSSRALTQHPDLERLGAGNSRHARALRMARQGLANGLPVVLLGETGSGKEVVARALHQDSARASKPFVAVNCAAIPEGLIESELFGYREGAFTGSRRGGMVGRLQQAHGGTLFLDEVGDMPLALQARLLRVLQERKVAPLGAGQEQDLDIALICATHRDLKAQVQSQQFREDLYYRIHGISVQLPALREREDLPALIRSLLDRLGGEGVQVSSELSSVFAAYHWPGNIRQLEMTLRLLLAMREPGEQELDLMHLPDNLLDELRGSMPPSGGGRMRDSQLALIRQAMERHGGNVSAAAQALGVSRATLYRKLKQVQP